MDGAIQNHDSTRKLELEHHTQLVCRGTAGVSTLVGILHGLSSFLLHVGVEVSGTLSDYRVLYRKLALLKHEPKYRSLPPLLGILPKI